MIVYYDESILSYVSSIRKHFGLESSYPSNSKFDKVIQEKNPKKIFLCLIDGMGANLVNRKLAEDSFLRRNMLYKTTTVFPPTTTAATTSIRNGKAPNENAWLGWCQYFKEENRIIIPFLGIDFYDNDVKLGRDFALKQNPITSTENELNARGIKARALNPNFDEDGCDDFNNMVNRLIDYSNNDEYQYIYAYWDKYDSFCHDHGPSHPICDAYLNYIDKELEYLSKNIADDTMLVIVADHGQIDVTGYYNFYKSKYEKYFVRKPSLEGRAQAFYIKDSLKDEFEIEFKKEFEDTFILLSHDQVLKTHLFGDLENNERFEEFIGDFIAIAKTGLCFKYDEDGSTKMKGHHAGMVEDELMIPVVVYQR